MAASDLSHTDPTGDDAPALRRFAKAFWGDDPNARYRAVQGADKLGPVALPVLTEGTRDPRAHVRECALIGIRQLADIGPDGLATAVRLLGDRSKAVRRQACAALAAFGPASAGATDRLVRLLEQPDRHVVASAAYALMHIGPPARAAAPALLDAVRRYADDGSLACYQATCALAAVAARDPGDVPVLVTLLGRDDELLNIAAADALAFYDRLPPPAVAALRRCARKPHPQVRIAAAVALWNAAPGDEPLAVLEALAARGADPQVRGTAAFALADLRPTPPRAAAALRTLSADRDPAVRAAAREALREIEAQPPATAVTTARRPGGG